MSIEVTVLVVLFLAITYLVGYLIGREQGRQEGVSATFEAFRLIAGEEDDTDE